jgi:hypothetical protein
MDRFIAIGRLITWAIFLFVVIASWGILGITPQEELRPLESVVTLLLFSGIPVVAVAELLLQNRADTSHDHRIVLVASLAFLPVTFFYVGAIVAHSSQLAGLTALAVWSLVAVALARLVGGYWPPRRLLLNALVFSVGGVIFIWPLSYVAWPRFYHGYLRPNGHLEWAPWLMLLFGFIAWSALLLLARWLAGRPTHHSTGPCA